MADVQKVAKQYFLCIENNKELETGGFKEGIELLNLVVCEDLWKVFFDSSFNAGSLREFFDKQNFECRNKYFKFGTACFLTFIQINFTGPCLASTVEDFLNRDVFSSTDFRQLLSFNNEEINVNVNYPALLVVAKIVFENCLVSNMINTWWHWRLILIHQHVLDELSPTLLSTADRLYKQAESLSLDGHIKAKLDIELAQLYLLFRHVFKAKDHIMSASEILGVHYNFMGKLGKRTKHQETFISQLALEVTLTDRNNIQRPEVNDFEVPQNVKLKDDVRLDNITFLEESEQNLKFPNTEQKLFLAIVQEMLRAKPQDDLQSEELQPFLNLVLSQKNTWSVRVATLLLRCNLESKFRRTVERALSQCEEIIASYKKPSPHTLNRVGDVFGAGLPPIWKVEAQYADIMLDIGLVQSSLDIYLKIKLWEEVIVCYTMLNLRHKAAEIIREQLKVKPSVKMWCLLGDATDDVSCYEKAWEFSKKRSHRAQRHWGRFLYTRKQYKECIPHFEKSVSINPLQAHVWLRLGYAALQVENWQVAATAYRRYTCLEPDGYEAWNNLAQAYIKMGNKRSAHQALLEALKWNFDNWKIWENLLMVSCDISHFSDVIRAYHKLLDIKEKYLNLEALNILVYNVGNDDSDAEEKNSGSLLQKTRELLGRVTSVHPGEGYVWELYANLAPGKLLKAQRLQRAYRGYTQSGWDKNPEACLQVLYACIKLAEIALDNEIEAKNTLINSIRLNLSSAIAAVKKQDWEETRSVLEEVSTYLDRLLKKIKGDSS